MQNISISKLLVNFLTKGVGKILNDGAETLAKPLIEIWIFLLPLELLQLSVELQISNLFLRKGKKLNHLNTDLLHFYHLFQKLMEGLHMTKHIHSLKKTIYQINTNPESELIMQLTYILFLTYKDLEGFNESLLTGMLVDQNKYRKPTLWL